MENALGVGGGCGIGGGVVAVPAIAGEVGAVLGALGEDDFDVFAGAGIGDAHEEGIVILRTGGIDPLEGVAANGVVCGEGEGDGVVGVGLTPAAD